MKPNDPDKENSNANLHLYLMLLCVAYASLSATVWIATCELSDAYQIGMDRVHLMLHPIWGWLGMFVVSLCFWRTWAIRQLMFSLWGLIACCCFGFIFLRSGSSPSHHFGPAGAVYSTLIRSILQPSLSNDSICLLVIGVTIILDGALVVGWLGLLATGQNESAWLRAKCLGLAFGLPAAVFFSFAVLNLKQFGFVSIIGFVQGTFGTPLMYLAICMAVRWPQARFPLLLTSALIAAIPALFCGGMLTVVFGIPCVLLCAIVSASCIKLPNAVR